MRVSPSALAAFLVVAEECHFGRAALRLRLDQGHVSRLVRQLEIDLQVQLFVRTTRRVAVSDEGQRLVASARDVIERLGRLHETLT